ncbi:MAG: hypothetical protein WAM11_11980 [Cyanobium sp.]
MVFKPKFFLDLGGADQQQPVIVAPTRPLEEADTAAEDTAAAASLPVLTIPVAPGSPAAPQPEEPQAAASQAPVSALTTAEAMAAELAAAQANRPAPSKVTFAPDRVTAGGATPMARRSGGANLAGFKEMAKGMMRS